MLRLTPLEVASGLPLDHGTVPVLPPASGTARSALEAAVLPALLRPPCGVSFSGGRDSSAVLAVAVRVARREGLPDPVPVTLRFPAVPRADERAWQERVVVHLGLRAWERRELTDELDHLGDLALGVLRRHGLLWPHNAHLHVPVLRALGGGSLLTGAEGDALLGGWTWRRRAELLAGRRRPGPRSLVAVVRPHLPRRTDPLPPWLDWLAPAAEAELRRALAARRRAEPTRWDRRVAAVRGRREAVLLRQALDLLARDDDVLVVHPLGDLAVCAALAAEGGRAGLGDRTAATRHLVGDLLPEAVLQRADKAGFNEAFWGPRSRAFAAAWDGRGLEHVDPERLRRAWSRPRPPGASATPLRAAALLS